MSRSVRLRPDSIEPTKQALKYRGYRNQRALAEELGYALATVSSFLNGRAVDFSTFVELCGALSLHWEDIADLEPNQPDLGAPNGVAAPPSQPAPLASAQRHQDWGDIPEVAQLYRRDAELATLTDWILHQNCRLVAILGMGGIGKTALASKLAQQIQGEFDYVIWRSLRNAPPISDLLADVLLFLSNQTIAALPESLDNRIYALIDRLRQARCLLVLDNAESILQSSRTLLSEPALAGAYLPGHEGYGQLLRCAGETPHQSCLVLTSREKPRGLAAKESASSALKTMQLQGLEVSGTQALLHDKGIALAETEVSQLNARYSGNPLAIKIVATAIADLFGGDGAQFLTLGPAIFGDISELLAQHFDRLSEAEMQVMGWLAINVDGVSLADLQRDLVPPNGYSELLTILESLQRRCLVETAAPTFLNGSAARFILQPVVADYGRDRLIDEWQREILTAQLHWFKSHAILKTQVSTYVKQAQVRLLLQPLCEKLLHQLGTKAAVHQQLAALLAILKGDLPRQPGYGGGNVFNLAWQLQVPLRSLDFSDLAVWQANLPAAALQRVNFAGADLSRSAFGQTLGTMFAAALSPDESQVALAIDNAVALWTVTDGQQTLRCAGHSGWVVSIAFSPLAPVLATGSHDHTVRLWDAASGQCLKTLRGHSSWVQVVAFSPDGRRLASGSNDRTIRLWDVATGQCLGTFQGHSSRVFWLAFSPVRGASPEENGQELISASDDQTVKRWRVASGNCTDSWTIAVNWMLAIALSPDGTTLATGSEGNCVKLWNLSDGFCRHLDYDAYVWALAYSPDGQQLVTAAEDGTLRLWQMSTGQCLKTLLDHQQRVWLVTVGAAGKVMVSVGNDLTLRLWDYSTGRCVKSIQAYGNAVYALAVSAAHSLIVSSHEDRRLRLWSLEGDRSPTISKALKAHDQLITALACSPQGTRLATGSDDHAIKLWELETATPVRTLLGHTGWVTSVAFGPNGQHLASGSYDNTVRLWDVTSGECLQVLAGHSHRVRQVAFHSQGALLASAGDDQRVILWDVATGTMRQTLLGHTDGVMALDFNPVGDSLASGGSEGVVKLWDVTTGTCQHTLPTKGRVRCVRFHPHRPWLASAGDDGQIYLWDVAEGLIIRRLIGHTKPIRALVFSPDGHQLISGSSDETIKIWEIETGRCSHTLRTERPYEGMTITGVVGLSVAEKQTLLALGAVED